MLKIELESKAQIEENNHEAFEAKLKASGFNTKAEWLKEQIRNFLGK